jgi:hypothetical protein
MRNLTTTQFTNEKYPLRNVMPIFNIDSRGKSLKFIRFCSIQQLQEHKYCINQGLLAAVKNKPKINIVRVGLAVTLPWQQVELRLQVKGL